MPSSWAAAFRGVRAHPVLRGAVRLLRLRHVDRPRAPRRRLRRRVRARPRAARAPPRPTPCSSAAARRRSCLRSQLTRILDAIPRVADAEVTVECNPDSVDLDKFRAYVDAGVNRVSFGVQSMRPHVLVALGSHPRSRQRRPRRRRGARGRHRALQPRPHLRHARRVASTTGRATLDAALALEPGHVSAYALTVEPGTPLGKAVAGGGAGRARRRRPGHQVRARRRPPHRRGPALVRGVELGPTRRRVPPQPPLLARGDYAAIGCAAHGPTSRDGAVRGGGTSARPSATSRRSPPGARRRRVTSS